MCHDWASSNTSWLGKREVQVPADLRGSFWFQPYRLEEGAMVVVVEGRSRTTRAVNMWGLKSLPHPVTARPNSGQGGMRGRLEQSVLRSNQALRLTRGFVAQSSSQLTRTGAGENRPAI